MLSLVLVALLAGLAHAASTDEWRGRSIYQLIVDRYAIPPGENPNACNVSAQTWCGGTWQTVISNLDYIQDMGFTAVWISPVVQNYDGPTTVYGDAYHGYWVANANDSSLNPHFGTPSDLKALSDELHSRGMLFMVDTVVNDVMATSLTPDWSQYMFTQESQYHPYCPVDYSNMTSVEECWMGDTNVPLPDLNTEDETVVAGFAAWIQNLVAEYGIDGLRLDAALEVDIPFWPVFCEAAGVFCMGEVDTADASLAATFQGPSALASILQYPMYDTLTSVFAIPSAQNVTLLLEMIESSQSLFNDTTVLGNFLENQDVARWHNISVDPQSLYNAMVFNFMSDGIPIVYYGQEQSFSGSGDPYNREALWPSNYTKTEAYNFTATLNQFRNFLVNSTANANWASTPMQVIASNDVGLAILKGNVVSIMTVIGSPPASVSIPVYTPFPEETIMTEILTCAEWVTGSNGTLVADYSAGGVANILIPSSLLKNSGICGNALATTNSSNGARQASLAKEWWLGFGTAIVLGWAMVGC